MTTSGVCIDYGVVNFTFVKFALLNGDMTFESAHTLCFSRVKRKRITEILAFFAEHLTSVDVVLGEQQMRVNAMMLELSNYVQLLCAQAAKRYVCVPASKKYPPDVAPSLDTYKMRKRYAVERLDAMLLKSNGCFTQLFRDAYKALAKKDDVADCVLMCLWFATR